MVPNPPPFAAAAGWSGAAMAVRAIQQIPRPILISLEVSGHGAIAIDPRSNTYVWTSPDGPVAIADFPSSAPTVHVGTYPVDADAPGLAGETHGVDALLWMIGLHSFPGVMASWLRPGDKYRLKWWPEFDLLPHTADQARAVKTLARSLMSVDKLARLARIPVSDAHDVVNALTLMGALRRVESADSAPMMPPVTAAFDSPARERGRHVRRGG